MRITVNQLRRIIKEETGRALRESAGRGSPGLRDLKALLDRVEGEHDLEHLVSDPQGAYDSLEGEAQDRAYAAAELRTILDDMNAGRMPETSALFSSLQYAYDLLEESSS